MNRAVLGLSLVLALAATALAAPTFSAPASWSAPASVQASAANFTLNRSYSDPASDVMKLYSSNMTPVVVNGAFVMSPFPDSVNILRIESAGIVGVGNVTLRIEVKGSIADLPNTTYEMQLYPRADNRTRFALTYVNGMLTLQSNATGSTPANLTGNSTITSTGPNPTSQNTLEMAVNETLLGNMTAWNIDATATERGANYSYRDFGWDLPGNPGSAPTLLTGLVTDRDTGAALAGVNVSTDVGGYWALTNASGGYSLAVAPGTYNVTFRLVGYNSATKLATATFGTTTTLNAQLQKTSVIESLGLLFWIAIAAVVVIALLLALLVLRRKKPAPPKQT